MHQNYQKHYYKGTRNKLSHLLYLEAAFCMVWHVSYTAIFNFSKSFISMCIFKQTYGVY